MDTNICSRKCANLVTSSGILKGVITFGARKKKEGERKFFEGGKELAVTS